MFGEPGVHVVVAVGAVVVADDVQLHPGVGLGDLFEEGQELFVGVSLIAGVRADSAGRDLQRGEQGGGAVTDVVVGLPCGQTGS